MKAVRSTLWGLGLAVVMVTAACGAHLAVPKSAPADYVPWLPLARSGVYPQAPSPRPTPPVPIPAGTAECKAADLQAAGLWPSAATGGNVDTPVAVRNRSAANCYLDGYPDLAILDSSGKLLIEAAGAANRGTYFNDWFPVQVLMKPATPPLPATPQPLTEGQAIVNVQWWDCSRRTAARLSIDLPDGGGNLTIPFPVTGSYYPTCDTNPSGSGLSRGPFFPAGIQWPPGPTFLSVDVAIALPPTVKSGSTLTYFVIVRNMSRQDYVLDPCPDYVEILGGKQAVADYRLNCVPVGHIAPGSAVKFEMRLDIPRSMPAGATELYWTLVDGRVGTPHPTAQLTVTA